MRESKGSRFEMEKLGRGWMEMVSAVPGMGSEDAGISDIQRRR